MQVQGNWVYIDSPKGQIKFHKDLKKYFEILSYFDVQRLELEKLISKVISASGAQDAANKTASALFTVTSGYILPELSKYGIYNLTVDDFVTANPGLQQIFDASNALSEYRSSQKDTYSTWANREKDKAEAVAGRTVTGPSFGIITNDWTDLMAYNFASSLIVASQTARAQKQFNSQAAQIDMTAQTQVDIAVAGKIQSSFIPQATEGLNQGFQFIISKFCEQLSSVGQIDLVCLQGIDKKRSDAVLKNLEYIPDKDAVVFQAIQLCPYNLNCYFAVFHDNLRFLTYYGETARYFGLDKPLSRYLQENYRHDAANMVQGYQENCSAIEAVGYFENKPLALVARDALTVDFQRLLTLHCTLGGYVKEGQPLYELLKERYPDTSKLVEYKGRLSDDLYTESSRFTVQVLTFCSDQCSIDVFASLSLWFGREIHSFGEAQGIILDKWQKEWEEIQAEREEEQRVKREQEKIENEKLQRRAKKLRKVLTGLAVAIGIIWVGYLVVNNIIIPTELYGSDYKNAETLFKDGDYVEAFTIYDKLGGYRRSEQRKAEIINYFTSNRDRRKSISASDNHTAAVTNAGTVVCVGDNTYGQCDVEGWNDIVSVAAGTNHTAGLKTDGTVVCTGDNTYGQCNVEKWSDIIAIAADSYHTVGLKANGTVLVSGTARYCYNQAYVLDWNNIVAITTTFNSYTLLGLKYDGTVIDTPRVHSKAESLDENDWNSLVDISAGIADVVVGLKIDGTTIIKTNAYTRENYDVSKWTDIVSVSCGYNHILGLKSDGTLVAFGNNLSGACAIESWENIIEISAGRGYSIGLKSDGTVVAVGNNDYGQCNVSTWSNIRIP